MRAADEKLATVDVVAAEMNDGLDGFEGQPDKLRPIREKHQNIAVSHHKRISATAVERSAARVQLAMF